jgi:iron complex transport system permease protein
MYGVLLGALAAACAVALLVGAVDVPLKEMASSDIIRLRAARILLGLVAGAGLSVAGVIFQALLRNPLADPYVLGVSSGAGLGAAVAIMGGAFLLGAWALPAAAFIGAAASMALVYALARSRAGATPMHTLLLSGVVVSALLGSLLMFLVSLSTAAEMHNVVWWLLGNLQVFDAALLLLVACVIGAGVLVAALLARDLNVLALGEGPAAHLGLNVERAKLLFFMLASLITGATVAACGLIGFVGLIVPHAMRLIVGADHRRLLPASALAGAAFMVLADAFGRWVIAPRDVPVGVVTAFLGGPFFLYLLKRRGAHHGR